MREKLPVLIRAWVGIGLMVGIYLLLEQASPDRAQGFALGLGFACGSMLFFDWLERRKL